MILPPSRCARSVEMVPQTGENVARPWQVGREDENRFALASQEKAAIAQGNGRLAAEIVPVTIPQRKGEAPVSDRDEYLAPPALKRWPN